MLEKHHILEDTVEIKIFILYLLDGVKYPLEESVICEIVEENAYVGSFDFRSCFSQLIEQGHILEDTMENKAYYSISDKGHMVAVELQDGLFRSVRENSRRSVAKLLSLRRMGATSGASYQKREDGMFEVHCQIKKEKGDLLDLRIAVNSEMEASEMVAYYQRKPQEIYKTFLATLSGEMDYILSD